MSSQNITYDHHEVFLLVNKNLTMAMKILKEHIFNILYDHIVL